MDKLKFVKFNVDVNHQIGIVDESGCGMSFKIFQVLFALNF